MSPHTIANKQKSRIWDKQIDVDHNTRIQQEEWYKHIINQSVDQHFPSEGADLGDIYLFQYQICPYSGKVKVGFITRTQHVHTVKITYKSRLIGLLAYIFKSFSKQHFAPVYCIF